MSYQDAKRLLAKAERLIDTRSDDASRDEARILTSLAGINAFMWYTDIQARK